MKFLVRFTTSVFALLLSMPALSQLQVDRSIIEFNGNSSYQDIELTNKGENKLYIDMTIDEIVNPELADPTRITLKDPRSASLLVNPRQILLAPGQHKRVRVLLREPAGANDRVYRLKVNPHTGKLSMNANVADSKATGIKVLIGYDLLVIVRPENLSPNVNVFRTDDSIEFSNSGNTNVMLSKIEQCDKRGQACVDLKPNRLYVGESYKVSLPKRGDATTYPVKVIQSVVKGGNVGIY